MDDCITQTNEKNLNVLLFLENKYFLEMQIKENTIRKKFETKFEKQFEKKLQYENDLKYLEKNYNMKTFGRSNL